jgi:hypothetical protein
MYTLQFPIPLSIPVDSFDKAVETIKRHTELINDVFQVYQSGNDVVIRTDSFETISKVHRIILVFPLSTTPSTDDEKHTTKSTSYANLMKSTPVQKDESKDKSRKPSKPVQKQQSSSKVDSTGKSSPVVVKKPIHPDIVSSGLIARTIGSRGCFMREIQEQSKDVQRISVGDKPGNYVYTIYASNQKAVDDTYLLLQKHEFDVIKECLPQRSSSLNTSIDSEFDDERKVHTENDEKPRNSSPSKPPRPPKVYPPGTSWVDMMDDDDDDDDYEY